MNVEAVRDAIEQCSGSRPKGTPRPLGGGCINEAFQLGEFFVKTNTAQSAPMFASERLGLLELARTATIRVPHPVCAGSSAEGTFLVLEFLPLGSAAGEAQEEMGRQLAALHRTTRREFGWDRDNFIGSTPQPNQRMDSWFEFFRDQRLSHMLTLAGRSASSFRSADRLLDNIERFFEGEPVPSLLHGDLWGGNAGALADGTPVLYDPAVYFGDREADLAMTRLFGGFGPRFYAAYEEAWPLPAGHGIRADLYNLYHILNHAVLFGGGYARQAQGMIDDLVARI